MRAPLLAVALCVVGRQAAQEFSFSFESDEKEKPIMSMALKEDTAGVKSVPAVSVEAREEPSLQDTLIEEAQKVEQVVRDLLEPAETPQPETIPVPPAAALLLCSSFAAQQFMPSFCLDSEGEDAGLATVCGYYTRLGYTPWFCTAEVEGEEVKVRQVQQGTVLEQFLTGGGLAALLPIRHEEAETEGGSATKLYQPVLDTKNMTSDQPVTLEEASPPPTAASPASSLLDTIKLQGDGQKKNQSQTTTGLMTAAAPVLIGLVGHYLKPRPPTGQPDEHQLIFGSPTLGPQNYGYPGQQGQRPLDYATPAFSQQAQGQQGFIQQSYPPQGFGPQGPVQNIFGPYGPQRPHSFGQQSYVQSAYGQQGVRPQSGQHNFGHQNHGQTTFIPETHGMQSHLQSPFGYSSSGQYAHWPKRIRQYTHNQHPYDNWQPYSSYQPQSPENFGFVHYDSSLPAAPRPAYYGRPAPPPPSVTQRPPPPSEQKHKNVQDTTDDESLQESKGNIGQLLTDVRDPVAGSYISDIFFQRPDSRYSQHSNDGYQSSIIYDHIPKYYSKPQSTNKYQMLQYDQPTQFSQNFNKPIWQNSNYSGRKRRSLAKPRPKRQVAAGYLTGVAAGYLASKAFDAARRGYNYGAGYSSNYRPSYSTSNRPSYSSGYYDSRPSQSSSTYSSGYQISQFSRPSMFSQETSRPVWHYTDYSGRKKRSLEKPQKGRSTFSEEEQNFFDMIEAQSREVAPLWSATTHLGRPSKFFTSLAYNPYISDVYRPLYGTQPPQHDTRARSAQTKITPKFVYEQLLRNFGGVTIQASPAGPTGLPLGCIPEPFYRVGGVVYYRCRGRPGAGLVQHLALTPTAYGWRLPYQANRQATNQFAFVSEEKSDLNFTEDENVLYVPLE